MRIAPILLAVTLAACDYLPSSTDVTGRWLSENNDGSLVFHSDGSFELLDKDGNSMLHTSSDAQARWQAVTEVSPHQLYILAENGDRTEKIPLGIYKIENGKLVIRAPTTYHNTLAGISLGVSRYEMPSDFSGIVDVYSKQ